MRLQEEIPVSTLGQATVDNGTVLGIGPFVGLTFGAGEKASMMAFTNDDDSDARKLSLCVWSRVQLSTCPYELRKLLIKHLQVLILRHPVAVDEEVLRKRLMISEGLPQP